MTLMYITIISQTYLDRNVWPIGLDTDQTAFKGFKENGNTGFRVINSAIYILLSRLNGDQV